MSESDSPLSVSGERPRDCARAKSDMTPCILRDGGLALADDGVCVGCGWRPASKAELRRIEFHRPSREVYPAGSQQPMKCACGSTQWRVIEGTPTKYECANCEARYL